MGGENLFQALRERGRPTYYGENRWPVTADKTIYGIVFLFLALAFSFYVVLIGVRGTQRLYTFARVTASLLIGAVILVCNFGYGWEYGSVAAEMHYKAFTANQIKAELGVKVGLRGINITLVGIPRQQLNTTINYNERFSWQWTQGKPGYGPQAGRLNREYRAAQVKGLPYPILWAVEYFTIDEGNFRNGRYYRSAGWFCHIALWMALPLWLLSNILFFMVIRYGAFYLALTGSVLLLTNILFASIRRPFTDELHFDSKPLVLCYGWCFYLVLITGLFCVIAAGIILFMDLRYPNKIATFFGQDVLQDYEDFYVDPAVLGLLPPTVFAQPASSTLPIESPLEGTQKEVLSLRKRTFSKRFQRSSQKRHLPPIPQQIVAKSDAKVNKKELSDYEDIGLARFGPIGEEEEDATEGFQEKIFIEKDENGDL